MTSLIRTQWASQPELSVVVGHFAGSKTARHSMRRGCCGTFRPLRQISSFPLRTRRPTSARTRGRRHYGVRSNRAPPAQMNGRLVPAGLLAHGFMRVGPSAFPPICAPAVTWGDARRLTVWRGHLSLFLEPAPLSLSPSAPPTGATQDRHAAASKPSGSWAVNVSLAASCSFAF